MMRLDPVARRCPTEGRPANRTPHRRRPLPRRAQRPPRPSAPTRPRRTEASSSRTGNSGRDAIHAPWAPKLESGPAPATTDRGRSCAPDLSRNQACRRLSCSAAVAPLAPIVSKSRWRFARVGSRWPASHKETAASEQPIGNDRHVCLRRSLRRTWRRHSANDGSLSTASRGGLGNGALTMVFSRR